MNRLRKPLRLPWLQIVVLTTVGMASLLLPSGSSGASSLTSPTSAAAALGVYSGPDNVAGVQNFESDVGGRLQYAMDFIDGSTWQTIANPPIQQSPWQHQGYSMIWGVPILPNSGSSLATGATGAYNRYFAELAKTLVAGGQGSSILRIGWEFNGIWFRWSATGHATQFVQYWRQIVTTMRSVPGANFTFEWNPSIGNLGAGRLSNYYPGNAYVDYVGLDVFDVEWHQYPGARALFRQFETEPYGLNWLASFSSAHRKPIVFPEWGLGWGKSDGGAAFTGSSEVSGGDNPIFINDMSHWFATHKVYEATYWDFGPSSVSGGRNPKVELALRANWSPRPSGSQGKK